MFKDFIELIRDIEQAWLRLSEVGVRALQQTQRNAWKNEIMESVPKRDLRTGRQGRNIDFLRNQRMEL